jgi:subtilisin family serine protease
MMKKLTRFALLLTLSALPALAANRFILRPLDNTSVDNVCDRHGLTIVSQLDTHNNVFLVTASDVFSATDVITDVSGDSDVVAIEEDRTLSTPEVNAAPSLNQSTTAILDQISTRTVISYFGQTLPTFYAAQPALTQLDLTNAQQKLGAVGAGIVAIIDTGIDPNHPVLKNSIVAGFDFTRNIPGNASEFADLDQSTTAILDQSTTAILDQSTTAILDGLGVAVLNQSTTAILDQSTGIVHLAAPSAQIMPLKAFTADGHGDLADIVRAIYYAADHGCSVINMSFSLSDPSPSLKEAIGYAQDAGCISIASTGNTGLAAVGYPAATPKVIAVASEDATGNRSLFSTFGTPTWVAAPGEQIVTTYPGNHWAVVSGTSFSAPFVSGGAALLKQFAGGSGYSKISKAFSLRRKYTSDLGYGNADLGQSLTWLINNP